MRTISVAELARRLGRDYKTVYSQTKRFARWLPRTRKGLHPEAEGRLREIYALMDAGVEGEHLDAELDARLGLASRVEEERAAYGDPQDRLTLALEDIAQSLRMMSGRG